MIMAIPEYGVSSPGYKISMTFTPQKNVQGNFNIDGTFKSSQNMWIFDFKHFTLIYYGQEYVLDIFFAIK